MARIFIASLDSQQDRVDLEKSVVTAIDRQLVIRNFSDATYPELIDIERRGTAFTPGPAPAAEHVENWFLMSQGDFVLISQNGTYRYYAKVLGRYETPRPPVPSGARTSPTRS